MRTRLTTGAVLAAAVALAGSALAAPSVSLDSVTLSGSTVSVTGTASFGDLGDGDVGGTVVSGAPDTRAFAPAGVQLTGAAITPLEDGSGLRFTWRTAGLPPSPPPEVTRYTWSFAAGGKTFQLQAKRSNVASSTAVDDPQGHLTSAAAGAFQLRGDCGAFMGTPVSSCPHLQFLTGGFDTASGEVFMDLPFGTQGIERGVVLTSFETATMSITAGFQAVVSNTSTSTYINDWGPFHTAPSVVLGTARAGRGEFADLSTPATLAPDGTFSGTTARRAGTDVVVARACEGTACTVAEAPLG